MRARFASAGATLAACALLAACGGGGGHASTVPAAIATVGPGTSTPFAITVASTSGVTKVGIASSAVNGSPEVDVPVAATSPNCSASGATRTCTASLTLPTGSQTLTITTYGTKTIRSQWQTTLSGARVALAIGTAIAQISLDLAAASLAGNQSATTTLYVTARDANGNTIVGDLGGATIALASSDTTGSITLSSASVTTGTAAVTVSYNGSGSVGSVTFSATSTGVATTAIVDATLSITSSTLMYVPGANSILAFGLGASGDALPVQRLPIGGEFGVGAVAPDGHGNLWVALFDQTVNIPTAGTYFGGRMGFVAASQFSNPFAIVAPTFPLASAIASPYLVTDFSVDGSGNLYVLTVNNATSTYVIDTFPPGATTPTTSIQSNPAQVGFCNAIAASPDSSQFAVNCTDSTGTIPEILVFASNANGAASPARTIVGSNTGLHINGITGGASYLAYGPDGTLYTNDVDASGNSTVLAFATTANLNVAPVRTIGGANTTLNAGAYVSPGAGSSSAGIGVDPTGAVYVTEFGPKPGIVPEQIVRFAPGANGAVVPTLVLGGPLTYLNHNESAAIHFTSGLVPAAPASPPSVTGDFLNLSPGRGWNYTLQPSAGFGQTPPPVETVSLYSNPVAVGNDTELDLYHLAGSVSTALGASGATIAAQAIFSNSVGDGWFAEGYVPVSSGVSLGGFIPIPGGLKLTGGTLQQGQTFLSYIGLSATVVSVGPVPGASACPNGATTGAIVAYAFGSSSETVGYVPGCGITYFVSDAGATATLTSIGSYSLPQPANSRRTTIGDEAIHSLRGLWRSVFTPWSPR
jgi:hypothetical protein